MNVWHSLTGMVEAELTSAEPEAALGAVNRLGIALCRVEKQGELTYRFRILRKDLAALSRMCEKRGETLKVKRRLGLYWQGRALAARPILVLGLGLLLGMALFLPSRIYFIRVDGNALVPERRILEAAEDSGIRFGASRRQVRSEKVKNALLGAVPELQWAGVNTAGCVATISVRERADQVREEREHAVSDIVAARDGFILSGTATSGNVQFQVGQTVREGQVLISGYTDCGICVRTSRSQGEVFAQTSRSLEAITPANWRARTVQTGTRKKISLLLGKKRINFGKDSGILDTSCGRMYEELHAALPGGFRLPLALCVETYTAWETGEAPASLPQAEMALSGFAEDYLKAQMVAGTIQAKLQSVRLEEDVYRLAGNYVCTEMIGRERQMGDTNE